MNNQYCQQVLKILQNSDHLVCVSEIQSKLKVKDKNFAQAYTSIALKKLRDIGVVNRTSSGKFRFYEINQTRLDIINQAENLL